MEVAQVSQTRTLMKKQPLSLLHRDFPILGEHRLIAMQYEVYQVSSQDT